MIQKIDNSRYLCSNDIMVLLDNKLEEELVEICNMYTKFRINIELPINLNGENVDGIITIYDNLIYLKSENDILLCSKEDILQ